MWWNFMTTTTPSKPSSPSHKGGAPTSKKGGTQEVLSSKNFPTLEIKRYEGNHSPSKPSSPSCPLNHKKKVNPGKPNSSFHQHHYSSQPFCKTYSTNHPTITSSIKCIKNYSIMNYQNVGEESLTLWRYHMKK